jgi:hypothetical protein
LKALHFIRRTRLADGIDEGSKDGGMVGSLVGEEDGFPDGGSKGSQLFEGAPDGALIYRCLS